MHRATIADVARAAGVSKGTVSKVLNGRESGVAISPVTSARVQAAARDLNYHPSLFARGLATKRSHLIGVVVRGLSTSFFAPLLEAVQRFSAEAGYQVVLGRSGSRDDQVEYGRVLSQIGVDGVLVIADIPNDDDAIQSLAAQRPVVGVFREFADPSIPCVVADNASGVRAALDHLVALGHRRIACLARRVATYDGRERLAAFERYVVENGLPYDEGLIQLVRDVSWTTPDRDAAYSAVLDSMQALLGLANPPTALLAFDDYTALQGMAASRALGLTIPEDLAVVGFGDFDFAPRLTPALTSVTIPVDSAGRRAAERLIARIEGRDDAGGIEMLPMGLTVRESSAQPVELAVSARHTTADSRVFTKQQRQPVADAIGGLSPEEERWRL